MTTSFADRSLERIAGLLAKAEATDNEHEAEAFMELAQKLSTLHSIDLAKARAHTRNKQNVAPIQRTITMGARGTKGLSTFVYLFMGIGRANDVKMNVAHNSTAVYAFGFPEDIEATETLFRSLVVQMVEAAQAFRKSGEWKNDLVWHEDRYGWGSYRKPVTWLTARINFQQAYAERIGSRLIMARRDAEAESRREDQQVVSDAEVNGAPGTDLVLADKRRSVADYYAATSRARGAYRGGTTRVSSISRDAGRRAANSARFSGQGAIGGTRGQIT